MFWKSLRNYKVVYSHLWRTYGQSWRVRFSFVLQLLSRLCKFVAMPIALSLIVARLSQGDFHAAGQAVFLFAGFSLLLGTLSPLIKYIGMKGENNVYESSTERYFSRLVSSDVEYFNSNLSGYLTTATRQYVDSCVQFVRALRDRYLSTVLSVLLPLVVIAWIDSWLGFVAIVLSIVQATYLLWASHIIGPYRTKSREFYKNNSGRMADFISNITAIKAAAQEESAAQQVGRGAKVEAKLFTERYTLQAKLIALREAITVTFFLILLWLTVQRMSDGAIEITAAVLVVTYSATILTGIYSLSENLDEHDDFVDKIVPALDIMDRKNTVTDPAQPKSLGKVRGNIRFQDVSFTYTNGGEKVFARLNLEIPAGQKVGVVGLSGAGKSTLTKLLLRFDDVHGGSVLVDGHDVREVRQTDLRRHIAYVPQEPLLFHASIRDNVVLSRADATDKEVQEALQTAHAWHFVKRLPEGTNSIVGERGVKLSGGQRQRIAIARAVLQKSSIMVLDEATSALDSESEQIIKDSFGEVLKGKTAIVVAHRLSTLSEMDRIIVLDDGKLVEDGTHRSLLSKDGVYARLWKRQQKHLDNE